MWVPGRARSSALTVAPAVRGGVEDPAMHGGKLLPVGQAASEFSWGWKTLFSERQSLVSLAGSDWWIAVAWLSAELSGDWGPSTLAEKMIFLITPELSRSFDPRLPVCHYSMMLLSHGEMLSCRHEKQVELFGAGLLFGSSCKAIITAIFSGTNAHAPTPVISWFSK